MPARFHRMLILTETDGKHMAINPNSIRNIRQLDKSGKIRTIVFFNDGSKVDVKERLAEVLALQGEDIKVSLKHQQRLVREYGLEK